MPDGKLREVAESCLAELCRKAPMGHVPSIVWRNYRVTAGMAYYRSRSIGLSTHVLKDESSVVDTVVHEYAHLLATHRFGRKAGGHGPEWRAAMVELGAEPKVRHCYEVQRNVARQKVTYRCQRCGKDIVRKRRLPSRRRYVHASCGGALRLTQVARADPVPTA